MSSVKPSKSWEIPARPKPGRKPTAATSATLSSSAGSELAASKSSQKAHRERKANYIAELETKVRNYEKEDGTKAVFFQRVAQKLKLENDALRAVVESLNLELSKRPANSVTRGSKRAVEQEHTASDARTKRARSSSTSQSDAPESSEAPASSTASSSEVSCAFI